MRSPYSFARHTVCACALLLSLASCQKQDSLPVVTETFAPNFALAKTNSELAAIQANPAANIVRTRQDLDALINSNKSPLIKLSLADRADLLDKLVFRKNVGVVSFYYGGIAAKLSYDDLAQVVAAFGLDAKQGFWGLSQNRAIRQQLEDGGAPNASFIDDEAEAPDGTDYKGYWCYSKGSCRIATGWICLSGC